MGYSPWSHRESGTAKVKAYTQITYIYMIFIITVTCVYLCTHEFVSVICMYLYMHQYFCAYIPSSPDTKSQLIGKDPDAGRD